MFLLRSTKKISQRLQLYEQPLTKKKWGYFFNWHRLSRLKSSHIRRVGITDDREFKKKKTKARELKELQIQNSMGKWDFFHPCSHSCEAPIKIILSVCTHETTPAMLNGLSSHFKFGYNGIEKKRYILHEDLQKFCAHLQRNSLNTYRREKYFQHKLQTRMNSTFCVPLITFP